MAKLSKKKLQKLYKRIRDRERRFLKMSPARKRVAIARDTLDLIDAGVLRPKHNHYFKGGLNQFLKNNKDGQKSTEQIRDLLVANDLPTCTACAAGCMFIATVLRSDAVRPLDVTDDAKHHDGEIDADKMSGYMEKFFSAEQMALIEKAFEGFQVFGLEERVNQAGQNYGKFLSDREQAGQINGYLNGATKIVRAIMQNIIDNNGTFVPRQIMERANAHVS